MSIKRWWALVMTMVVTAMLGACGGGSSSNTAEEPPRVPLSLAVEPGDEINTVTWPTVPSATSYDLYWSETSPLTIETAQVITDAESPYVHTGRTNGKTVYYAVVAVNAAGKSELSREVGAMPVAPVPGAPNIVNATPGSGQASVDWAPVSRATHYNLYWSLQAGVVPGAAGVTKIENIAGTSFAHLNLTNGQTYYYVVTAVNSGGESAPSKEAQAKPLPPAPGAPANFVATGGDTKVTLSWSPSLDAASYNVYWSKTTPVVPGAAGVTQVSGITSTSFTHSDLTNGETYYYVVSSVGAGGESEPSSGVSSRPRPPAPPSPLGLTAVSAHDIPQVALQWYDVTGYPSENAPLQPIYNLYRGLEAGLAGYYKDASRATKVANVTAPFIDESVVTGSTYYYVVTASHPAFGSDVESAASGEVSATAGPGSGGGGGGGGGHEPPEEGLGSNLSFPVVFADGYGITGLKISGTWQGLGPFDAVPVFDYNTSLRPLSTETLAAFPRFDSASAVSIAGVTYYPQGTSSSWQAEWRNNAEGGPMDVIVDWGDSLISRSFSTSSMIRIETILKQDATIAGVTDTMKAYKMVLLSGSGITELQGTDGTSYDSATRYVFAVNGRLTIEKLSDSGSGSEVVFDQAVYEGFGEAEEGPDQGGAAPVKPYGVEINQTGSVVYGYNFWLSKTGIGNKAGQYRITFSLDPQATVGGENVQNHVKMVGKADAAATLSMDGRSSSVVITVTE